MNIVFYRKMNDKDSWESGREDLLLKQEPEWVCLILYLLLHWAGDSRFMHDMRDKQDPLSPIQSNTVYMYYFGIIRLIQKEGYI